MNEQWNSLPEEDRPYEKCERYGVQALTNRELLAVILRTGARGRSVLELAGELLKTAPEKEGFTGIRRMSLGELSSVRGIGRVKAIQLKCVLEIARRMAREEAGEGTFFRTPDEVADYYMEDLRHEEQEVLLLLMLNQNMCSGERSMLLLSLPVRSFLKRWPPERCRLSCCIIIPAEMPGPAEKI